MNNLTQTRFFKVNQVPAALGSGLVFCLLVLAGFGLATAKITGAAEMETESIHNPHHQNKWSKEQKEIWAVIEQFDEAFATNNPEEFFKFVGDEITVITPGNPYRVEGKPDDREEFEFLLAKGITKVGLFQEMQPYVFVSGDMAFVTFYARGFFEASERMIYWKITDVLRKTADGWKVVHIHLSE